MTYRDTMLVEGHNYYGIGNSQVTSLKILVNIDDKEVEKPFLDIKIPTLLYGQYFYIHNNYYVPTCYIVDMPISSKKDSCKIFGLFNSMSFDYKQDHMTFMNMNFTFDNICQLLFDPNTEQYDLYKAIQSKYKLKYRKLDMSSVESYFSNMIKNVKPNRETIIKKLENLLFDDYIKPMYKYAYGFKEVTLKNVVEYAFKLRLNQIKDTKFNDLKNKRVIFLESLFTNVFRKIGDLAINASANKNYKPDLCNINDGMVFKYFLTPNDPNKTSKGLSGDHLYTTSNMYDGCLQHKISMVPPNLNNPPKDISQIHQSYFNKICPITMANQDPGKIVSATPGCKISDFGLFL
jgi:hypothetical protein